MIPEAQVERPPATSERVRSRPAPASRQLRAVGLFAGIGGLELGMGRAGHQTQLLCEVDPIASAVLRARFPHVNLVGDIAELDALPPCTELVVAGFPCQDLSQAGKTVGIGGARSGLVRHVFRLLAQAETPHVVLENVPFMLQLERGRALDVLVSELERLGYAWAYRVVDARAFGVPQRRLRVLLYASKTADPRAVLLTEDAGGPALDQAAEDVACGFYWTEGIRGLGWAVNAVPTLKGGSTVGVPSPPAIWLPDGQIVTPDIRDAERLQGFPRDWTRPALEVAKPGYRWRLVGNAVCVPVARWLGERLARPARLSAGQLPGARPLERRSSWPSVAWGRAGQRYTADVSAWPRRARPRPLADFLRERPRPLSARATAGFLERTRRSSLRFPPGLIPALERHLANLHA